MGEIPGQRDPALVEDFYDEAFVMDSDLLGRVAGALGMEFTGDDPHQRVVEEIAFRQGYGEKPGLLTHQQIMELYV